MIYAHYYGYLSIYKFNVYNSYFYKTLKGFTHFTDGNQHVNIL